MSYIPRLQLSFTRINQAYKSLMCQEVLAAAESSEVLVYENQEQQEQSEKYHCVIELRNIYRRHCTIPSTACRLVLVLLDWCRNYTCPSCTSTAGPNLIANSGSLSWVSWWQTTKRQTNAPDLFRDKQTLRHARGATIWKTKRNDNI